MSLSVSLVNAFLREIQGGNLPNETKLESFQASSSSPQVSLGSLLASTNKHGDTAFLVAARHGHVTILGTLHKDYGTALEQRNLDGKTALHEAAQNGQTNCVEYLIREGAEVDALKRADW